MEKDKNAEPQTQRQCAICGCTDNDCAGCIERTGLPCSWVNDSCCSACVPSFGRL